MPEDQSHTQELRSRHRKPSGNEEQATSTSHCQTSDNTPGTSVMEDSNEGQQSVACRRTLVESSAEDIGRRDSEMWHNELSLNSESSSAQPEKRKEKNPKTVVTAQRLSDILDVILRVVLVLCFFKMETMSPFKREIHQEELWLYKNPPRPDIVKGGELLFWVIVGPFVVTLLSFAYTRDRRDFRAANWAWTLGLCMNGIPTSLLKITVGRPRPDYFYRCFPDGVVVLNNHTEITWDASILDFNCTGNPHDIIEGRKSFPSGHSSFAFASFGFIAYYVGAKLHAFDARGRGHTWRLCIAVVPLVIALLVAVSRTCDYHHHWQDVSFGGLLGLFAGYISYRQYFPSIFGTDAGKPFYRWPRNKEKQYQELSQDELDEGAGNGDCEIRKPLLEKKLSSWN